MIGKKVMFRAVKMEDGQVASSSELEGTIWERIIDSKVEGTKVIEKVYYLVADEEGSIYQVRPFNILRFLPQ
jgi:hypothetical protein